MITHRTTKMLSVQLNQKFILDISIRMILWTTFLCMEHLEPFIRQIHPNEVWKYQYPAMGSYVTSSNLWFIVFFFPTTCILVTYAQNKNKVELVEAFLSLTLNYGLVGCVTQFLKLIVGRPRPNFYNRCFPEGKGEDMDKCTGNHLSIMDGRKSFPSGHSSFAFSSMLFLSLYLAGKLRVFNEGGRGVAWRLCSCMLPLLLAAGIAVSRTCDYHHHWEDVLVGSFLGSLIAYICYRQHFPSLHSPYSHIPYILQNVEMQSE